MPEADALRQVRGTIFALDQTATHDGPGVRMTIFVKGCPLRCRWCHSPESWRRQPEIVWYQLRCEQCGACAAACPERLPSWPEQSPPDRECCKQCGVCLDACPAHALEVKGYERTAGDLADEAERLKPFFDRTGGGVTLTGGEPTGQFKFTHAVATLCRQRHVHVAVETCGCAPWERLAKLAEVTDLFLYDVKDADADRHERNVGAALGPVLGNLGRLVQADANVIVRVPVIPGCSGSADDIAAIAKALRARGATEISLLPFNPASHGKYSWLRLPYPLEGVTSQTREEMCRLEDVAREVGLSVVAS